MSGKVQENTFIIDYATNSSRNKINQDTLPNTEAAYSVDRKV